MILSDMERPCYVPPTRDCSRRCPKARSLWWRFCCSSGSVQAGGHLPLVVSHLQQIQFLLVLNPRQEKGKAPSKDRPSETKSAKFGHSFSEDFQRWSKGSWRTCKEAAMQTYLCWYLQWISKPPSSWRPWEVLCGGPSWALVGVQNWPYPPVLWWAVLVSPASILWWTAGEWAPALCRRQGEHTAKN